MSVHFREILTWRWKKSNISSIWTLLCEKQLRFAIITCIFEKST
jgi:hypothetical protein